MFLAPTPVSNWITDRSDRRAGDRDLAAPRGNDGGTGGDPAAAGCPCGCDPLGPLLNTKQAAAYLGVSAEYLEKLRTYGLKRGAPPKFTRIRRRVAYQRAELDAFIMRNRAETTAEYHPH